MSVMKDVLGELAKVPGVSAAVVVSRDGFVMDGVTSNGQSTIDMETVGAVVSASIGAAEVVGQELNVGPLAQSMIEYANGIVVFSLLAEAATLAVVADLKANLGNVRYQVKKHASAIAQAL